MHRNPIHFALIGLMVLLGISFLTFSILTSRQTKPKNEIEHSKAQPQKSQWNERRLPQIIQRVDENGKEEAKVPSESISPNDSSGNSLSGEQETVSPTPSSIPSIKSDEEEVIVRIKELEEKLWNYDRQVRELGKQSKEIFELIRAHQTEGREKLIEEIKAIAEEQRKNPPKTEEEAARFRELVRQKAKNYDLKVARLLKMDEEVNEQIQAIGAQSKAIYYELIELSKVVPNYPLHLPFKVRSQAD